jgi:hypothetical protein
MPPQSFTDRNGNPLHPGDRVTVECTVEEIYGTSGSPSGLMTLRLENPHGQFKGFALPAACAVKSTPETAAAGER